MFLGIIHPKKVKIEITKSGDPSLYPLVKINGATSFYTTINLQAVCNINIKYICGYWDKTDQYLYMSFIYRCSPV